MFASANEEPVYVGENPKPKQGRVQTRKCMMCEKVLRPVEMFVCQRVVPTKDHGSYSTGVSSAFSFCSPKCAHPGERWFRKMNRSDRVSLDGWINWYEKRGLPIPQEYEQPNQKQQQQSQM